MVGEYKGAGVLAKARKGEAGMIGKLENWLLGVWKGGGRLATL